jgi:putative phosphotransacetylase
MNDQMLRDIVYRVSREYIGELQRIPAGISNRHVHLCQKDMDELFGRGSALRSKKALRQPGQFAADETVNLRGPGGFIQGVRVLGPIRQESQIEISQTDGFKLGLSAPVRESGDLEGTPGIVLEGPFGNVVLPAGVIAAWRHIHLSEESARFLCVHDKEMVSVETEGPRGCVLKNVLVRVSSRFMPEMHVDIDEANACGLKNGDIIRIQK